MAKWDSLRNDKRNKALTKFRDDNPHWSFQEIGDLFDHITRQRAQQIYKKNKKQEIKCVI